MNNAEVFEIEEGCEDAHAADREAAALAGDLARRIQELQPLIDQGPNDDLVKTVQKKLEGASDDA